MEGNLGDLDIHLESGVLDGVGGEVLDRRHGVALDAPGQGCAHLTDVVRIFTVGLLGSAPGWMTEQVDTDPAIESGPHGPQFSADDVADPLLEVHVEGGSTSHRDGEGGGTVHHHASWSVGEGESGDAES